MAKIKNNSFNDDVDKAIAVGPQPQTGVTPENYLDKAKAYVKSTPLKQWYYARAREGRSGSIETGKAPTDAQWIAWMDYRKQISLPLGYVVWEGVFAAPAEWPELFDAGAPISDRFATLPEPRRGFYIEPERGAKLHRALGGTLGTGRRPGEYDGRADARLARSAEQAAIIRNAETDRLKAARERYMGAPPPPLMPESREALGLPPLDDEIPM